MATIKDLTAFANALEGFAEMVSESNEGPGPWHALLCSEADTMAELLTAAGYEDTARGLIENHAYNDEEGDAHYRPELGDD